MGTSTYTLYFRQIPEGYGEDELSELFSRYGEIVKLFIHHNSQYGMVEYADIGSCDKAIESLHFTKPLNMYVQMARTQKKEQTMRDSDNESSVSTSRNNMDSQKYNKKSSLNMSSASKFEDVDPADILYIDRFGKIINVFMDESGVVYAPIHQVTGVRRVIRKDSALAEDFRANPNNYQIIDDENSTTVDSVEQNGKTNFHPNRKERQQKPMQERRNVRQSFDSNYGRFDRAPRNDFKKSQTNSVSLKDEDDWSASEPKSNSITKSQATTSSFNPVESVVEKPRFNRNLNVVKPAVETLQPNRSLNAVKPAVVKKYNYISIPIGKISEMFITDLENNEIWVQFASKVVYAAELSLKAEDEVKTAKVISNPVVDLPCLGKFEGLWFRAIIINTKPLTVRYVDFGNIEQNPSEIREISKELCDIPAQAVQIKFIGKIPHLETNQNLEIHVIDMVNGIYNVKMPGEHVNSVENKIVAKKSPVIPQVQKTPVCPKELMIYQKLNIGDDGMLLVTKILSPGKFIAGILPTSFAEEIATLEKMSKQKPKEITLNPKIGDRIFAESSEDGWCRAVIIEQKQDSYVVGFIDYGYEGTVTEVHPVPNELSSIPWLSCICTVPNQFAEKFSNPAELNFQVVNVAQDTAIVQIADDTKEICLGQISIWDPTEKEVPTLSGTIDNVSKIAKPIQNNIKKQKRVELKLTNGEVVSLMFENEGFFYLQNEKGKEISKKIETIIKNYVKTVPNLKAAPVKGQLIAAPFADDYYRAIIIDVRGEKAKIVFVDYGNEEIMVWSKFKNLNSELDDLPISLIKVKPRGHDGNFSTEELKKLSELTDKEGTFKVTFETTIENGIDLLTKDGTNVVSLIKKTEINATPKNLSKLLRNIPKVEVKKNKYRIPADNEPIILIADLPITTVDIGEHNIKILNLVNGSVGLVTFCIDDETKCKNIFVDLAADIQTYVNNLPNSKPYEATSDEIVLVKESNEWKRGIFIATIDDGTCNIFCIDHGSVVNVESSEIRRLSPDMTKEGGLALFGNIQELEISDEDEEKVKKVVGKKCLAKIVEKVDDSYVLQVPTIINELS